jgi:alpha-galactosidase
VTEQEEQRFVAIGGPDADAAALCVVVDRSGHGVLAWYGDWRGPAPRTDGMVLPSAQRWGARLDEPLPALALPGAGRGDSGAPALEYLRDDGRWRFVPERTELTTDATPGRCCLVQQDAAAELETETELMLDRASGGLRARTRLHNRGADGIDVRWLAVLSLPLPFWVDTALETTGDWCGEFRERPVALAESSFLRETRSGRSSHDRPPMLLLSEGMATADRGRILAVSLAWSGDHRLRIDRLADGTRVLQAGVLLHPGEGRLEAGATLTTPALWCAVSSAGRDGITARLHEIVRTRVARRTGQRWPRPVHLNTWEALYFDHEPARLRALAAAAAAVGVERFVLDDGWFRGRRDDRRALGDWQVDAARYPEGLEAIIDGVRGLGMEFGLWVEPEMVSPDSELARAHPEWIRGARDGSGVTARHQRVLDLAQPAVVDHLFAVLDGLLSRYAIGYLKWDHNRVLTESARTGHAGHLAQTRALHELLERLNAAHPEVEIESCASGGGRADWGMLAFTHRVWTSDANDPVTRARIMAGATPFLPPEYSGVHVGPARAHVTGRVASIDFRAAVALLGHFGLELDLLALTDVERARLSAHVLRYKRFRDLLHAGAVHTPLHDDDHLVRLVVAADRRRALLIVLRLDDRIPGRGLRVRLAGLDPSLSYRVLLAEPAPEPDARPVALAGAARWRAPGEVIDGAWLVSAGLGLQLPAPQQAAVFELIAL